MRPAAPVYQRLPSGPPVIPVGSTVTVRGNSVTDPDGVTLAILLLRLSVIHMLPSGPGAIPVGPLPEASGNAAKTPAGVIRATLLLEYSVNQRLPSGPAAMPSGWLTACGTSYSTRPPARAIVVPSIAAPMASDAPTTAHTPGLLGICALSTLTCDGSGDQRVATV